MAINFSFQATSDFAEHTQSCANMIGLKNSDYVREAVREKNERVIADHITMLSRKLSAKHHSFNEAIVNSLQDGVA
ncbi:MAG: antitoxin of toxin-antitoxin stability system [Burkholderiaceae bacterium]|nr:antitoxin of toxin-antitoxin stability system [Burkholderiaceae bacterium]